MTTTSTTALPFTEGMDFQANYVAPGRDTIERLLETLTRFDEAAAADYRAKYAAYEAQYEASHLPDDTYRDAEDRAHEEQAFTTLADRYYPMLDDITQSITACLPEGWVYSWDDGNDQYGFWRDV